MNLMEFKPAEALNLLDSVLESLQIAVFVVKDDYKINDVNRAFKDDFQVDMDELMGFGDVISCVNAVGSDKTCGYTDRCVTCKVRGALEKTFKNKESVENLVVSRTTFEKGRWKKRHFKLNTKYCEMNENSCALVMIEDITEEENKRLKLETLYKSTHKNEIELSEKVVSQSKEISRITMSMINALENVNYYNDTDTGNHIRRVCKYSAVLAKGYGCSEEFIEKLELYASLHDVGKVGISDDLLKKTGRYTRQEWESMQNHVVIGARMIESAQIDEMAVNIVKYHHEWFDGTGYKYKLKGDEIPLEARIVALADVYDALSTKRSYKEAFPDDVVDQIILENSGIQFDPELVQVFFRVRDQITDIKNKYTEEKERTQIGLKIVNGIRRINLNGRLTFDHVDEFTEELKKLNTRELKKLKGHIINLENIQTIDSVGFGFLIKLSKVIKERCCLVTSDEVILELLDVFKIKDLFEVFPDSKSAVRFINSFQRQSLLMGQKESEVETCKKI